MIAGLAAAVQFLTIVPPLVRRPFSGAEMGRAVGWFPLVGVLIGGLLALVDLGVRRLWPAGVSATLVLATWAIVTGGLHLDGLMDACDGLLGGRTGEDRLRILRDPRVGSFAVIGGVLVLLTKWAVLASLADRSRTAALLATPMFGRFVMAGVLALCPYVRAEGTGRAMKDRVRIGDLLLAIATTLLALIPAAIWTTTWPDLLAALAAASIVGVTVAIFSQRRIGGITGDICGAACELAECAALLVLSAPGVVQ